MNQDEIDEKRKLNEDFYPTAEAAEIRLLDINEALDGTSCGWGTLLYTIGTFFFCALEGAEMVVLTIVGPILRCEWGLTPTGISTLQTSTIITMMITPLLTCNLGDRFGRRRIALIAAIGVTTAGVLSGCVRSYWQFIGLRLITGFFIGLGAGPAVALSGEVTPNKMRALALSGFSLPWGIGGSITGGIAYLTLNVYGWRGLIICTALTFSPCILFLAVIRESARFQYHRGNVEEAEVTIKKIYKLNRKDDVRFKLKPLTAPPGEIEGGIVNSRGILTLLRGAGDLNNCLLTLLVGITNTYSYYLNTYTMPKILNEGYCSGETVSQEKTCNFDMGTLFDIGIISLSEPLSVALMLVLLEMFGRIKPGILVGVLSVLLPTALHFCVNKAWVFWFMLLLKVIIAAQGALPAILMAEYSPTVIRSSLTNLLLTGNRIGGLIGIVCSEHLYNVSVRIVFLTSQVANLVFVFCMAGLSRDTVGTDLN